MGLRRATCILLIVLAGAGCAGPSLPSPTDHLAENDTSPQHFAAVLLRATNRVRKAHGRSFLQPLAQLNAAADDQAAYTALLLEPEHVIPLIGHERPLDRVRRHGIEPTVCAENLASVPAAVDGRFDSVDVIVDRLIEAWMNSPGHRANLLNADVEYFGGSVRLARNPTGHWLAFGAQVFVKLPD